MNTKTISLLTIFFLLATLGGLFMFNRQGALLKTSAPQSSDEAVERPVHVVGENTPVPVSDTCIAEATACEERCAAELVPETEREVEYEACLEECASALDVCMFNNLETPSL